ncbi:hypothetical protein J8273_2171 [Carpediemonas membranifera]|uniref:Uncharacterized protein n=1 Tax=Carpediemonas membranifera TaxID=201153 RepID=A0A8J6B035_9EUKA|nr:hypothetical protein J8273_2171 [Carpediemonas membranifera]|eukprot:KAG9396440.1 hypothetical protein J8273_2171 [Carpediemonas membranifera]
MADREDRFADVPADIPDIEEQHICIVYNTRLRYAEAMIRGRSGAYINGIHYSPTQSTFERKNPEAMDWRVVLGNRAIIQLGHSDGPHFRMMFLLPTLGVVEVSAPQDTRADPYRAVHAVNDIERWLPDYLAPRGPMSLGDLVQGAIQREATVNPHQPRPANTLERMIHRGLHRLDSCRYQEGQLIRTMDRKAIKWVCEKPE